MKGLLDAKNDDYVARAREVAEKYIRPVAAELDEKEEYPWSVMAKLQEYGLTGVWIPKEYGGKGDGVLNLCLVVEELSRACGGVGVLPSPAPGERPAIGVVVAAVLVLGGVAPMVVLGLRQPRDPVVLERAVAQQVGLCQGCDRERGERQQPAAAQRLLLSNGSGSSSERRRVIVWPRRSSM